MGLALAAGPFFSHTRTQAIHSVPAPVNEEACFSPDEPCDLKLIGFMDSARQSLDVAIFDLTLESAVDELVRLSAKKVAVRIVVDRKQAREKNSRVPEMIRRGLQVRYGRQRGTGIMHNKFTVVDGRRVELGSFNYTNHASRFNHENQVYLESPAIVKRYAHAFEELWSSGEPVELTLPFR